MNRLRKLLSLVTHLLFLLISLNASQGHAWRLPEYCKKSIVHLQGGEVINGKLELKPLGTGFVVLDLDTLRSRAFLVTARHLIENRNTVYLRFNRSTEMIQQGDQETTTIALLLVGPDLARKDGRATLRNLTASQLMLQPFRCQRLSPRMLM